MEVDDDGRQGSGCGGDRGSEKTEPEVAGGVDGNVGGLDAVNVVATWWGFGVKEVNGMAIDVDIGLK